MLNLYDIRSQPCVTLIRYYYLGLLIVESIFLHFYISKDKNLETYLEKFYGENFLTLLMFDVGNRKTNPFKLI